MHKGRGRRTNMGQMRLTFGVSGTENSHWCWFESTPDDNQTSEENAAAAAPAIPTAMKLTQGNKASPAGTKLRVQVHLSGQIKESEFASFLPIMPSQCMQNLKHQPPGTFASRSRSASRAAGSAQSWEVVRGSAEDAAGSCTAGGKKKGEVRKWPERVV